MVNSNIVVAKISQTKLIGTWKIIIGLILGIVGGITSEINKHSCGVRYQLIPKQK